MTPLSNQKFLFVYQTTWRRRLLSKYGNDICLLDATYKTTWYALPLFFLAVKTNVYYQVVASFVLQDESTDFIKEALQVIKDWNPDWQPDHSLWMIFVKRKSKLLRRHFQVSPNSVFFIYNVLCMCSTLKRNRYITHLMLTLLFFFFFAFDTLSQISNKGNFITSKFEVSQSILL